VNGLSVKKTLGLSVLLGMCLLIPACGENEKTPQPQREAPQSKSLVPRANESEVVERNWEPSRSPAPSVRRQSERVPRGRRFAQDISMPHVLKTIVVSHQVTLPVTLRNTSGEAWKAANTPEEKQPVNLAYHWIEGSTVRQRRTNKEMSSLDESPGKVQVWRTSALQKHI
jgi:hypothetical protein